MTKRRGTGIRLTHADHERGLVLVREGASNEAIIKELKVSPSTIGRWRKAAHVKPKMSAKSPGYLNAQLHIIMQLLRDKLPEITKLTLTALDGKPQAEYTVRETTLVSKAVKL